MLPLAKKIVWAKEKIGKVWPPIIVAREGGLFINLRYGRHNLRANGG